MSTLAPSSTNRWQTPLNDCSTGHAGVLGHEANEALATARDHEVDQAREADDLLDALAIRRGDDPDGVLGQPGSPTAPAG